MDLQGASSERTFASGISQTEEMVFLAALSGERCHGKGSETAGALNAARAGELRKKPDDHRWDFSCGRDFSCAAASKNSRIFWACDSQV